MWNTITYCTFRTDMTLQAENYMERIKAITSSLMALRTYGIPELTKLLTDFRDAIYHLSAANVVPAANLIQYKESMIVIEHNINNGLREEAYLALFINTNNLLQEIIRHRQNA